MPVYDAIYIPGTSIRLITNEGTYTDVDIYTYTRSGGGEGETDNSIIKNLRDEIMSPGCDIINVLRNTYSIIHRQGLNDFNQWISYELYGYPDKLSCPDYRKVRGSLRAVTYRGLTPVRMFYPEIEDIICEQILTQPLSEIISLCKNSEENSLVIELPGEVLKLLTPPMQYVVQFSCSSVGDIVEKVKNALLEWTFKLEESGSIHDEKMQPSNEEKHTSKSTSQTINNFYAPANVVNSPSEGVQIAFESKNMDFFYGSTKEAISKIESDIKKNGKLQNKDKSTALKKLSKIRHKVSQKKSPSVIRHLLLDLRDFLLKTGGTVIAGVLTTLISNWFPH